MNEELERLETLERHGMLTNASDQNALAELRKKPAKKAPAKKAAKKAPAKKAAGKKTSSTTVPEKKKDSGGEAN